jgi:16S rRNA (uracil1498-N3)-methyltransferase
MTAHQFFIRRSQIDTGGIVKLAGRDARHIRLVLRLRKNTEIRLVDENHSLYLASVEKITAREVVVRIMKSVEDDKPPMTKLTVIQGIPRLPKADLITEKLTELGVSKILFVPTEHSPYQNAGERISKRLVRLRTIAEAAAKQCLRNDIPEISAHGGLREAVETLGNRSLLLVAREKNNDGNLRDLLANAGKKHEFAVVIGPEGGLSPGEIRVLDDLGARGFSLGQNILRTETAAIVAAAIILYEMRTG